MSNTPKTDALIDSLTIEQAREYEAQADKLCWIEYNLLDPAGISRIQAERVEDALLAMLAIADADARTSSADLPTYSELAQALRACDAMIQAGNGLDARLLLVDLLARLPK